MFIICAFVHMRLVDAILIWIGLCRLANMRLADVRLCTWDWLVHAYSHGIG